MDRCRECGGELEIIGLGGFADLVMVECKECGEVYEVEPDGLGMAGEEFVIATMIEEQRRQDTAEEFE